MTKKDGWKEKMDRNKCRGRKKNLTEVERRTKEREILRPGKNAGM